MSHLISQTEHDQLISIYIPRYAREVCKRVGIHVWIKPQLLVEQRENQIRRIMLRDQYVNINHRVLWYRNRTPDKQLHALLGDDQMVLCTRKLADRITSMQCELLHV